MANVNGALEILPSRKRSNILLCAEHSGVFVPPHLRGLGLPTSELHRHIGHDIGIADTVRRLHKRVGLLTLLGNVSRLVVDLNRPVSSDECIPEVSDGTVVPANQNLSYEQRMRRITDYYLPFHRTLNRLIAQNQPSLLLCLHSFTPQLRAKGTLRPWHCGVLFDRQVDLGQACISHLARNKQVLVGENQPYRVDHDSDKPVPLHGELKGVPTLLLEIRNDLIGCSSGQAHWVEVVADLVENCLLDWSNQRSKLTDAA